MTSVVTGVATFYHQFHDSRQPGGSHLGNSTSHDDAADAGFCPLGGGIRRTPFPATRGTGRFVGLPGNADPDNGTT